jgi:glucose/arabinose dehydrogenase/mono/diheme cytochrome c family protein
MKCMHLFLFKSSVPFLVLFALLSNGFTGKSIAESFDPERYQKHARTYTPEESMAMIEVAPGYRLELVAAEPMVEEPATMAWDGDGKLYVAELNTYMQEIDGKNQHEPVCRVVLLEDTNHDGRMDKRSVFVDGLKLPRMIQPLDDRVIIRETDTFDLHSYRDTDGDGVADEKKLVYQGGPRGGNLEHQPSGLEWNVDNWMYVTYTDRRYRWVGDHIEAEKIPGGSGQWGVTHDDVGRNFYCTAGGENPAMHFQIPMVYGKLTLSGEQAPGFREVFPLVQIPDVQGGRGRFRQDTLTLNRFTGCAGQHIYRGDRLPSDFYGDYIIPEPVGRLVRRAKVVYEDGKLIVKNATPGTEFLRSKDANFRPVHASTGPDGCLYITDMYRGIIQEGSWVRPGSYLRGVVENYGLDKNIGRGRIYRLVHETTERGPRPKLIHAPSRELVSHLSHPNGWWRDTAQKLLVVRGDPSVAPELVSVAKQSKNPLGRLHALWTLDGLGVYNESLLLEKLGDEDERLRAAAVRMLEPQLTSGNIHVTKAVLSLVDDSDLQVVTQLLLSIAQTATPGGDAILEQITERYQANPNITGVLNHVKAQREIATKRRLENAFLAKGRTHFEIACLPCHGMDGKGMPAPGTDMTLGAPIADSPRVTGRMDVPIKIMLKGMTGELDGRKFPGPMLPLESFDDEWIAATLTYIRSSWGNKASMVTARDVAAVRMQIKDRETMWDASEIVAMTPVPPKQMRKWRFTSSHRSGQIKSAIDGNSNSRWDTGAIQVPGMWLAFDMGKEQELTSLVLDSRRSKNDYPRQYSVEISEDGQHWSKPIAEGYGQSPMLQIVLPPTKTRHVRISQHGHASGKFWSIHELEVYTK